MKSAIALTVVWKTNMKLRAKKSAGQELTLRIRPKAVRVRNAVLIDAGACQSAVVSISDKVRLLKIYSYSVKSVVSLLSQVMSRCVTCQLNALSSYI